MRFGFFEQLPRAAWQSEQQRYQLSDARWNDSPERSCRAVNNT